MFTENNNQKTDLRILREENKKQNELIVEFKGEKSRKEKEFGQLVDKLTRAEEKFTKEQGRVEEEERERKDKEKKEWDRVWNEHEIESISRMKGVCRKPEIDFIFYDNENLPDGFSGRFKPDFLVKFLEHYVIFDAKFNKPESNTSLQEYLKKTAKGTAKKIKESGVSDEIYKTVFFVVPSVAVGTLQQVSFFEDGISFHAISIEAVEPILSAFKKVTYYKNIEAIDPQERENIISVFAAYDQQITLQNAFNILGAGRGEMVLEEAKKNLSSEMKEKIETKKGQIRIDNFKPIDLKRLVGSVDERKDGIKKMVISKSPLIKDTDIKEAQESLL
ncbi:hypothetical protein K9M41_01175 [Candidatus Gracilibacteria bacterium]|nr:hypothetical protein [Candidatus Gracilibacteria bacterium]